MTTCNNHKGFLIIENIIVLLLIAVMAVVSLNCSVYLTNFVERQLKLLVAFDVASSQLEDLKDIARMNYDDNRLSDGRHTYGDNGTLFNLPAGFIVNYYDVTADAPNHYKTIKVECTIIATDTPVDITGFVVNTQ